MTKKLLATLAALALLVGCENIPTIDFLSDGSEEANTGVAATEDEDIGGYAQNDYRGGGGSDGGSGGSDGPGGGESEGGDW